MAMVENPKFHDTDEIIGSPPRSTQLSFLCTRGLEGKGKGKERKELSNAVEYIFM